MPSRRTYIAILLGAGTLAIALKFPTYWDRWVYFPTIPNVIDSAFLVVTGLWLITEAVMGLHRAMLEGRAA